MELTKENINYIFHKYQKAIDDIAIIYHYPNNVKHLLSIVIPSFLIKYGLEYEQIILECFMNIPIIINVKEDKVITAFYGALPKKSPQNTYTLEQYIVLNSYDSSSLLEHFDNLIHEFNHAINSYRKSIIQKERHIIVRSGISLTTYVNEMIMKKEHVALEEIVNTKQTEEIIDLILQLSAFEIDDYEINTALYSIKNELKNKQYHSLAYSSLGTITRPLLENKTFMKTMEKLRLNGEIEEIIPWFDHMTNKPNSFHQLSFDLDDLWQILRNLSNKKRSFFQKRQIQKKANNIKNTVSLFQQNCLYK